MTNPLVRLASMRGKPLRERLAARSQIAANGCMEWIGTKNPQGYGQITIGKRSFRAHRVAWIVANGRAIPSGLVVMHSCDNPGCINPAHLSVGTTRDNVADRDTKGRMRPLRGVENGFSKLSEDQVREIRSSEGTLRACAERFGVHLSLIWLVRKRKIWTHI